MSIKLNKVTVVKELKNIGNCTYNNCEVRCKLLSNGRVMMVCYKDGKKVRDMMVIIPKEKFEYVFRDYSPFSVVSFENAWDYIQTCSMINPSYIEDYEDEQE